jgi:hypothetical protein
MKKKISTIQRFLTLLLTDKDVEIEIEKTSQEKNENTQSKITAENQEIQVKLEDI